MSQINVDTIEPATTGGAVSLPTSTNVGIGVGQTWTDVTSSRAKATEYQNTTGKPIMVSISFTTFSTPSAPNSSPFGRYPSVTPSV